MAEIVANTTPSVGVVVILEYTEKGTWERVRHFALIVEVGETGLKVIEANFNRCHKGERFISYNDPHIHGFYQPS